MGNIVTKLVIWSLNSKLSLKNKNRIMNQILNKLNVIPIRNVVAVCEDKNDENYGQLLLNGKPAGKEELMKLREGAKTLLTNVSRRFVQDQITYMALNHGAYKATTPDALLFSKAAIWIQDEENKLYKALAGIDQSQF